MGLCSRVADQHWGIWLGNSMRDSDAHFILQGVLKIMIPTA